jgi:hypothetical protein
MVQLTPKLRTFVIKTFYETSTLQQTRGAFGLINFALLMYFQFPTVEECDFDRKFLFHEYMAISHRYGLGNIS